MKTLGRIVKIERDTTEEVNDEHPTYIYFTFTDKQGRTHSSHSDPVDFDQAEFWSKNLNKPLIVYYDPNKPEEHLVLVESDEYVDDKLVSPAR